MKKDYYRILEINPSASSEEIKSSYRRLARQHHPDVSKGSDSAEVLAKINEAYEVLGNPESRRSYDMERNSTVVTNLRQQVKEVVDDYFNQLEPKTKK